MFDQKRFCRALGALIAVFVFFSACDPERARVPVDELSAPNATLHESFRDLSPFAIRELNDGRVLITESKPNARLLIADFDKDSVSELEPLNGKWGEYDYLFGIHALGNDSSMLIFPPHTWVTMYGTRIVDSLPISHAALIDEQGFDSTGFALVHLFDGASRRDSGNYAMVKRPPKEAAASIAVANTAESGYIYPIHEMARGEQPPRYAWRSPERVVLFKDGWVAVARHRPYRVDWRAPDGTWTKGGALPVKRVRVNNREKSEFRRRRALTDFEPVGVDKWPREVPPFLGDDQLLPAPDGTLWIPRTRTARHLEMRYDVVNRSGRLERQVTIGDADRILGFGKTFLYVVSHDSENKQHISRHRWQ